MICILIHVIKPIHNSNPLHSCSFPFHPPPLLAGLFFKSKVIDTKHLFFLFSMYIYSVFQKTIKPKIKIFISVIFNSF